jgi:2-polyprenyl-6-hydroxyphenyl methylase/3-demethylubiquinone-9 3-methyltransferase
VKRPTFDTTWNAEMQALHRHDMQEMWDRSIAPQIWNQYHNQLDIYCAIAGAAPLRVLDVGCAQGTLALLLAERGHRVTAVDLRPEFLAYAKSRHTHGDVTFVNADAMKDDLPGGFDLVFANQLIEHLVHPVEFVTRLAAKLRPGGRLVVTTPNHAYVRNALPSYAGLGDPKQWEHRQNTADADGHFYAYTRHELVEVFRASGLERIDARFFESPWISGHMKLRYLHGMAPAAVLRALDRLTLALPGVAGKLAHQLLVTGVRAP